jgi:hypothetical protein
MFARVWPHNAVSGLNQADDPPGNASDSKNIPESIRHRAYRAVR